MTKVYCPKALIWIIILFNRDNCHPCLPMQIYPEVTGPGKTEHRGNTEVTEYIKCATFGRQYLTVLRGFQDDQWVFNDKDNLWKLLDLSERIKSYLDLHIWQMITLFYNLYMIFGISTRILEVLFYFVKIKVK